MMTHTDDADVAYCPICADAGRLIRSAEFSQRASLPMQVGVYVCANCSFGFNHPRHDQAYKQYYASHQNDQLSQNWQISESERKRYQDQISVLRQYLSNDRALRVLDFGCGQGGLLHTMALGYERHHYFGCDANAQTHRREDGVSFHRDLAELAGSFDVIVLSHVVEHLIDFGDLSKIENLLSPDGIVYIEVPNAGAYEYYSRREFLYYFDRLHVNHFTSRSLAKIGSACKLVPVELGDQRFGYKDGKLFPAIYAVFARDVKVPATPAALDLNASFSRYVETENGRLAPVHDTLRDEREVVAYGFGDNFFRSFGRNGPMSDISLVAVVDQRASELSAKVEWRGRFNFLDRETASARFPNAVWVMTVSWGGEAIAEKLQGLGISSSRILIL